MVVVAYVTNSHMLPTVQTYCRSLLYHPVPLVAGQHSLHTDLEHLSPKVEILQAAWNCTVGPHVVDQAPHPHNLQENTGLETVGYS